MAFNVMQLGLSDADYNHGSRASELRRAQTLTMNDIVILSEFFYVRQSPLHNDNAFTVLGWLVPERFKYRTPILASRSDSVGWDFKHPSTNDALKFNGGVVILSKWEIECKVGICYPSDTLCGWDSMAEKGFVYARIKGPDGKKVHVIGTHTQANDSGCKNANSKGYHGAPQRAEQFKLINDFLNNPSHFIAQRGGSLKLTIPNDELIIIGGDLNVDKHEAEEYKSMIATLGVREPEYMKLDGETYSFDTENNGITRDREKKRDRELLDYVFYRDNSAAPASYVNGVQHVWSSWFCQDLGWHAERNLSDHYAVTNWGQHPEELSSDSWTMTRFEVESIKLDTPQSCGGTVRIDNKIVWHDESYSHREELLSETKTLHSRHPGTCGVVDVRLWKPGGHALTWGDRHIYCDGGRHQGRVGDADKDSMAVTVTYRATKIAPGKTSCVWGMGRNDYGQLGNGKTDNDEHFTPEKLKSPIGVVSIAPGADSCRAVTANGDLYVWGDNEGGQLGTGDATSRTTPTKVENLPAAVAGVACGEYHTLILLRTGEVMACGKNPYGQLGTGKSDDDKHFIFTRVPGFESGATKVACSRKTSYILKGGEVWAFGFNGNGECGQGDKKQLSITNPARVRNLSGVTDIAGGGARFGRHCLAVMNGKVYAWGENNAGQLGNGKRGINEFSATPEEVQDLSGVSAVSACGDCSMALANGDVYTWGHARTGNGRPGTGSPKPVKCVNISGVSAISCGYQYCMALKDGAMYSWGSNSYGELGNGKKGDTYVPSKTSIQGVTALGAGGGTAYVAGR